VGGGAWAWGNLLRAVYLIYGFFGDLYKNFYATIFGIVAFCNIYLGM
jgi:hypothetical protein